MNQYRRRYCILFTLALTVFLGGMCGPAVANASEPDGRETVEATFDLELNQPQSETVYLSDGRTAEIGIRPASAIRPLWDSYYDNSSGNWEIYYNSPIIYRIFISLLVTTQLLTLIALPIPLSSAQFRERASIGGVPTQLIG